MWNSELASIPSELIRSTLCETIENELKSKNYTIKVEVASQTGADNFIGIVFRINYEKEAENERGNSLILKIAPQNIARRDQFHARPCFIREIYMYIELLPYFRAFERSKGIATDGNAFSEYPKCHRTIAVEFEECLLLEDLKVRGFMPINRYTEELTVDHVRLYLQAIAKFHAISFVLKDQQPDEFQRLTSHLNDVFLHRNNASIREYFEEQAIYVMSLFPAEEDANLLTKLRKFFNKDALDICIDGIELESVEEAAIVSYGDANLNNTMYRCDSNGHPVDICLIDWQASRLASPVTDIIYFMFACVTKDVRDPHYDHLLKVYHECLSTHIRRLGSDPEQLFSYEMMQEHFRKFAKYGIILAYMVLPILTSDPGTGVDLDKLADDMTNGKDTYSGMSTEFGERFNKRMRDIVIDMDRLGYI